MTSDGDRLTYTLENNSSLTSFLYGLGPSYERSSFGPGGNLRQTYQFSEAIDMSRIDNGAITTTDTPDGLNGGDPEEFEALTNTGSDWSAGERGLLSRVWNRLTR